MRLWFFRVSSRDRLVGSFLTVIWARVGQCNDWRKFEDGRQGCGGLSCNEPVAPAMHPVVVASARRLVKWQNGLLLTLPVWWNRGLFL